MQENRSINTPENPLVEPVEGNRTRVSWQGNAAPEAIQGLKVSYCKGGMMCLGPIDTPVRYECIQDCEQCHVIELQLSLSSLKMLALPRSEARAAPKLVVHHR